MSSSKENETIDLIYSALQTDYDKPTTPEEFIDYLIDKGEKKGKIPDGNFMSYKESMNIVKFIKFKYHTNCQELHLDAYDVKKDGIDSLFKNQVSKILDCIKKNLGKGEVLSQIPVFVTSKSKEDKIGHANLFIINLKTNLIIRIDSNGCYLGDEIYYFKQTGEKLADIITEFLGKKYTYINFYGLFQNIEFQKKIGDMEKISRYINPKYIPTEIELGTCILWSRLFGELVLQFPDIHHNILFSRVNNMINSPEKLINIIRGYYWYLFEKIGRHISKSSKTETKVETKTVCYFTKELNEWEKTLKLINTGKLPNNKTDVKKILSRINDELRKIFILIKKEEKESFVLDCLNKNMLELERLKIMYNKLLETSEYYIKDPISGKLVKAEESEQSEGKDVSQLSEREKRLLGRKK